MALPAYALVTLAAAKTRLGVTDSDRDGVLEGLIAEVSRAILKATGREYAPASTGDRVLALKNGSSVIDLYPYEARSVSGITIAADTDDEYEVPLGDWQLDPITSPDGVYDSIRLKAGITVYSGFGVVPVTVTGAWGWAAVPSDAQGWALEMIEDRWKQDFAYYADADGLVTGETNAVGSQGPVTIPYRIRDEMDSVRRVRIGSV